MSAPEVGDRVRVIAGQWTGWEGVVTSAASPPYLWVDLEPGHEAMPAYPRTILTHEVEKVPTTPDNPPQSDEQGANLLADPDAVCGPQIGGKR